jgi:hypothetical protein
VAVPAAARGRSASGRVRQDQEDWVE